MLNVNLKTDETHFSFYFSFPPFFPLPRSVLRSQSDPTSPSISGGRITEEMRSPLLLPSLPKISISTLSPQNPKTLFSSTTPKPSLLSQLHLPNQTLISCRSINKKQKKGNDFRVWADDDVESRDPDDYDMDEDEAEELDSRDYDIEYDCLLPADGFPPPPTPATT